MKRVAVSFAVVLLLQIGSAPAADDPKGIDFFEKNIRPVLVANCYQCHSASSKELGGELRLDTREGMRKGGESGLVIVPGKPGESPIVKALRHEDGLEMPPKDKLPDSVAANFAKWIEMGAPDPRRPNVTTVGGKINILEARKFWSFQPPKIQPPAAAKNAAWPASEIDKYVLAKLEEKSLKPVSDADRRTLIRRAYFDLIGLPPTPEEVEAFIDDKDPQAFENLIDRLLAMPQFGERWGRHWLDVARYGESSSKERNIPYPMAWKYRDYVYDSVAADKPYDQFIKEQIAGDLLKAKNDQERNDMLTATGFLAIGPKSLNTRNAEQFRMDTADEQLDVATRGVMALSVACARCHDHKFDPIPTAEYYAMAGIFRSTDVLGGIRQGNNRTGYAGQYVSLVGGKKENAGPSAEDQKRLKELNEELVAARAEVQAARKAAQAGGDDDEPNKAAKNAKKAKNKKKAQAANKKALEKLPQRDQARIRKLQQRVQQLTGQVAELEAKAGASGDVAMGVQDNANPEDCRINIRGEVTELGDSVPRGFVRVLTYPQSPDVNKEQSGRLQLAVWMTSKENPLSARVMANRVWFHLFGRGIVPTVDNFGALGEAPANQPLLDYLAVRFMNQGWSVKKLIREVMLSRTYQLSSEHNEANYAADPDNTLVWRMNRRRLEAEAIRDAILFVGGNLDLKRPEGSLTQTIQGGEIGRQARTAGVLQEVKFRSAYLPIVRGLVPEFLSLFDVADSELVVGQRDVTTVAPQALYLMNSPVVLEQAESLAKRVLESGAADDKSRVNRVFEQTLSRPADSQELADVLAFVTSYTDSLPSDLKADQRELQAWTSVCQSLLASAEFRYVY
jgi:hypothetical protein